MHRTKIKNKIININKYNEGKKFIINGSIRHNIALTNNNYHLSANLHYFLETYNIKHIRNLHHIIKSKKTHHILFMKHTVEYYFILNR